MKRRLEQFLSLEPLQGYLAHKKPDPPLGHGSTVGSYGVAVSRYPLDGLPLEPFVVVEALFGRRRRLLPSLNSRLESQKEEIGALWRRWSPLPLEALDGAHLAYKPTTMGPLPTTMGPLPTTMGPLPKTMGPKQSPNVLLQRWAG